MKNNTPLRPVTTHCKIEALEARIAPAGVTFTVTTLKDVSNPQLHDSGSLRDAIILANLSTGTADSIEFAVHGAIKLDSDLPAITDALTISGPTLGKSNGIIINGNKHQIFSISGGDTTLSDLTVMHGQAQYGGGIYVDDIGFAVHLDDLTISGNHAINGYGGGIDIRHGTVTITGSKISKNLVTGTNGDGAHGGGIFCSEALTITDSVISGNVAKGSNALGTSNGFDGGGAYGGGIYVSKHSLIAYLTIQHSVISGNKALGGNGSAGFKGANGIAGLQGQTGVNGANGHDGGQGGEGAGGGIYAGGPTVTIISTTISGNLAKGGNGGKAGAGGKGGAGGQSYTIGGVFHHAGAGGNGGNGGYGGSSGVNTGGGVSNTSGPGMTINSSTISGNTVSKSKGGAGGVGGAAGAGSYTVGNVVHKGSAGTTQNIGYSHYADGGGIYSTKSLILSQVTIAKNSAGNDGGGIAIHKGPASIHNCTIVLNKAKGNGGGIDNDISSSDLTSIDVESTIIALNKANYAPDVDGSIKAISDLIGLLTPVINPTGNENHGTALTDTSSGNTIGTTNLHLGSLGMHGGPTATMLPSLTSSAVNAGSDPDLIGAGLNLDQRGTGFARLLGSGIDIGAVEVV